MDRDKRWDRVKKLTRQWSWQRGCADTRSEAVQSYESGKTDEFLIPTVILDKKSHKPIASMQDGDGVIFCNFRSDRAREITQVLTASGFHGFSRVSVPRFASFVCLTTYDESFDLPVAFAPMRLTRILGEVLSSRGVRQLRIAETEKYAHVTFFFNGGEETPFPLEDRILIPSPRDVATYDKKPEMSARELTDALVKNILSRQYGFILANFANPDMVGHTGVMEAAIKTVEVLDECLGRVLQAAHDTGAVVGITADHGNIEQMKDPENGQPFTAHSTNMVPFILFGENVRLREGGLLADVAPTVLALKKMEKPEEMTGNSLILDL
jgi:2,3-bisphosphoglycerate-independent phosphoglycerate mutase